jgi:Asp-tRNA(Asn)/Glu-tRNA(Gln) amidotransferase A subunit family amidase
VIGLYHRQELVIVNAREEHLKLEVVMLDDQLIQSVRVGEVALPEYLAQVEAWFAEREPSVLAFIPEEDRFERLHREAEELLLRFPDPENRPPLFGVLAGVKDNFHVDGFITQAGSRLPWTELQGSEAESVTRLKNAGALILGKTFTTEFAYFSPGPTRNPHNPEHTPGGSSSGSAASVGAGLCPLALGTQTIGSVIRPAAFCGAAAFKPTYDRIPRDGVVPLSSTLDHVGVFAQDISLARRAAASLCEDWDAITPLDRKPILGIPQGPYLTTASAYALAHFRTVCDTLAEAGYEVRGIPVMREIKDIRARHQLILAADAAHVHETWFEKYENLYGSKLTELIRRGQSITASDLQDALRARDEFRAEMTLAMQEKGIDLWISPPSIGSAPQGLGDTGDPAMNLPWTQLGFPAVNIPTEKGPDGLPMGLQVIGTWNMDEELLAWAEDIEKVVSRL